MTVTIIFLFICAGLSFNLILHFALGAECFTEKEREGSDIPVFQGGVLFVSTILLWFVCTYLLSFLAFGFLEYFLLFPLSAIACMVFEKVAINIFFQEGTPLKHFSADSGYNGLALTSLFLTLQIARTLFEAMFLALSFVGGVLLTMVLIHYISKRSYLESIPVMLRGRPLILISLGLLSLIFTSLTVIFLRILDIF